MPRQQPGPELHALDEDVSLVVRINAALIANTIPVTGFAWPYRPGAFLRNSRVLCISTGIGVPEGLWHLFLQETAVS